MGWGGREREGEKEGRREGGRSSSYLEITMDNVEGMHVLDAAEDLGRWRKDEGGRGEERVGTNTRRGRAVDKEGGRKGGRKGG